jgi:hypothetical protein
MSRKNKTLRGFLHQNPDPSTQQTWDAAWEAQGKKAYTLRMQELEAELLLLRNNSRNYWKLEAKLATERANKAEAKLEWLDNNSISCDNGKPVLSTVSRRIWYHATDDIENYPFSAVIAAAMKKTT